MLGRSLGLDIGSHSIKAVELRQSVRGVEVTGVHTVPLDDGVSASDAVRALFESHSLPTGGTVCAIPGDRVTRRQLSFPFRDRRRITQALPFEIESEMPFELPDVFIDWERVGDSRVPALVAATVVQRSEVAQRVETIREAGVDPRIVEVEGLVLGNLAEFVDLPGTRLLVDIGHRKTTLCLLQDGRPRAARTLPAGGKQLTAAIARERDVALDEAERIKCEEGIFGPDFEATLPAAVAALERMVHDLVRALGGLEASLGEPAAEAIDEITLLGGGARLHRIDEYLAARLGIHTARLQVPPSAAAGDFLAAGDPLLFGPALALALRGSLRARTHMNFLQAEFAPRVDVRAVGRRMRVTAALTVFALALAGGSAAMDIYLEQREADRLDASLAALWQQAAPGKPSPRSVPSALRQELRDAQQRADFLGIYGGNLSALDLLTEISAVVPAKISIIFEEVSIDGQVVRIRGHTPSFAAVDQLKAALMTFPYFSDVRVSEIQADASRGGNTFSVTISLADGDTA